MFYQNFTLFVKWKDISNRYQFPFLTYYYGKFQKHTHKERVQ